MSSKFLFTAPKNHSADPPHPAACLAEHFAALYAVNTVDGLAEVELAARFEL
ncbi:hypothetical protein [Syntrophomonas zehnderi]|uniref:hypothetical protein n=1 Tax=Syntrophomonas zehnderi TaxID=404335 RepID=UPI001A9A4B90|nr:hypothetical protein [Syntrophomonas zehnderi]